MSPQTIISQRNIGLIRSEGRRNVVCDGSVRSTRSNDSRSSRDSSATQQVRNGFNRWFQFRSRRHSSPPVRVAARSLLNGVHSKSYRTVEFTPSNDFLGVYGADFGADSDDDNNSSCTHPSTTSSRGEDRVFDEAGESSTERRRPHCFVHPETLDESPPAASPPAPRSSTARLADFVHPAASPPAPRSSTARRGLADFVHPDTLSRRGLDSGDVEIFWGGPSEAKEDHQDEGRPSASTVSSSSYRPRSDLGEESDARRPEEATDPQEEEEAYDTVADLPRRRELSSSAAARAHSRRCNDGDIFFSADGTNLSSNCRRLIDDARRTAESCSAEFHRQGRCGVCGNLMFLVCTARYHNFVVPINRDNLSMKGVCLSCQHRGHHEDPQEQCQEQHPNHQEQPRSEMASGAPGGLAQQNGHQESEEAPGRQEDFQREVGEEASTMSSWVWVPDGAASHLGGRAADARRDEAASRGGAESVVVDNESSAASSTVDEDFGDEDSERLRELMTWQQYVREDMRRMATEVEVRGADLSVDSTGQGEGSVAQSEGDDDDEGFGDEDSECVRNMMAFEQQVRTELRRMTEVAAREDPRPAAPLTINIVWSPGTGPSESALYTQVSFRGNRDLDDYGSQGPPNDGGGGGGATRPSATCSRSSRRVLPRAERIMSARRNERSTVATSCYPTILSISRQDSLTTISELTLEKGAWSVPGHQSLSKMGSWIRSSLVGTRSSLVGTTNQLLIHGTPVLMEMFCGA